MAIGTDPREWIVEILGVLLALGGLYHGWVLGDFIVIVVSASLAISIFSIFQLRRAYDHSIT
ncbi:hypothetical protein [Halorubrum halodurans]|uniref:Uncharacterized protein n=1 Tax=Halorubrum halodurans TaxID=1383851 RepID=A0A256ICP1_9EURY|nr:hypothetical protein [Halorubrum halodurans]OYR54324.1 hypothetical protein DJ70_14160 [Halorubrum halodurans]